jgi:hypothetical protein
MLTLAPANDANCDEVIATATYAEPAWKRPTVGAAMFFTYVPVTARDVVARAGFTSPASSWTEPLALTPSNTQADMVIDCAVS